MTTPHDRASGRCARSTDSVGSPGTVVGTVSPSISECAVRKRKHLETRRKKRVVIVGVSVAELTERVPAAQWWSTGAECSRP